MMVMRDINQSSRTPDLTRTSARFTKRSDLLDHNWQAIQAMSETLVFSRSRSTIASLL
jgi:hypothetical protein